MITGTSGLLLIILSLLDTVISLSLAIHLMIVMPLSFNKFFADIACDPAYNRENVMSFIRECDNECTAYFEQ